MIILAIDTSAAASVALVDGERLIAERTEFADRRHIEFVGTALEQVLASAPRPDAVVVGVGPGPFTGLRAGIAAGIGAALGVGVPVHGVVSHDALALRAFTATAAEVPKTARAPAPFLNPSLNPSGIFPAPDPVGAGSKCPVTPVVVATDARRREVYATVYSGLDEAGLPIVLSGPAPLDPAALAATLRALGDRRFEGGPSSEGDGDLTSGPGLGGGVGVRRVGRGFSLYPDILGEPEENEPEDLHPTAEWLARIAHRTLIAGRELPGTEPLYLREPDAKPGARRTTLLT